MRIFYASTHTTHSLMPTSRLWYINLYLPLLDLGHDVVPFDYDLAPHYHYADILNPEHCAFIEENRPKLEQSLLAQIEAAHKERPIDLFFSYFYSAFCRPEVIREIGSLGITTANWYCNGSYQFHLVQNIAPAYDYCLVPEKFRLEDYRRIGASPIYFQEAANPNFYKPYPSLTREYDVAFIGQKYGDRPEYVRYLLDQGIDVRVWGWGWLPQVVTSENGLQSDLRKLKRLSTAEGWQAAGRRLKRLISPPAASSASAGPDLPLSILGPPLPDEEMIRMYSRSKISLGFSTCGETHRTEQPIKQVRLRDFEAPMSGAFYMVEYMEELEEFFQFGKEIVCYHDKADLTDKIKYYLAHEDERERLRLMGHRRALAEHTWQRRFEQLFQEIGLT